MMRIKLFTISIVTLLVLSGSIQGASAFDLFGGACTGNAKNSPSCQQAQNQGGANNRVTGAGNIINVAADILAIVTGIAAIIIIIIGGLTLVTSGGSSEAVTNARRRIIYALIGLVVVALAWTITRFITDRLVQ
jgi:hypothetical protein